MSHFSVLVVTDTPEQVEDALWPFHEFECTGEERYIQDIDITDEARQEYEEDTNRVFVSPQGQRYDPYSDMFYRDPTDAEQKTWSMMGTGFGGGLFWTSKDWGDGRGYRAKIHQLPDGWSKIQVPVAELQSFTAWIKDYYGYAPLRTGDVANDKHKYGYVLVDAEDVVVRIVRRTNPNKKWDWWTIGGRYLIVDGRTTDQARYADLDLAAMAERRKQRRRDWRAEAQADKACGMSDNQLAYLYHPQIFDDTFIERDNESWTFAVLLNGEWIERGQMGWWGVVIDGKNVDDWDDQYQTVLARIRPDQYVTVVDCHI